MFVPRRMLQAKLRRFMEEDVGAGDVTTHLLIPPNTTVEAEIVVKQAGLVAGLEEACAFCESLKLEADKRVSDGASVRPQTSILHISGKAQPILSAERTLLNLLSRMSGIATVTSRLVRKVRTAGYETRIACTRKVAPGLGYFDKKAVFHGGGDTHRLHLDDMILIKDNHLQIVGDAGEAVKKSREAASFSKKIEVEVTTIAQALEAAEAGADIIMLDNFPPAEIREAVSLLTTKRVRDQVLLEASGGITETNILEYAATGIDIVSIGEITHSVKALDMSLEIVKVLASES
jgi:nicotinate-nucleotide pyrophosphorylase (carboxylating)